MKKIIIYSLLIGSMIFPACEDMLEKNPIHKLSASEFFTTENDLEIYANSFYEYGLPSVNDVARGDGMSDYAAINTPSDFLSGEWDYIEQKGWDIKDWKPLRNINYFLERAPEADVSEVVLNHYLGLARYWRAVFYLEKVQIFGDVPWYDKVLKSDDPKLEAPRDSRDLVMGKVLEDINFAVEHVWPNKDSYSSKINKYTALALKSRICLYEGTYRKYHTELGLSDSEAWLREAADAAKKVMDSGKYDLINTGNPESDYRSVFTAEDVAGMPKIAKEVILTRLMNTDSRVWHDLTWNFNSPTNGSRWSLIRPFVNTYLMLDGKPFTDKEGYDEIEFLSEMKNRDHRLSQTIRTEGYKREDGSVAPPNFSVTLTGYHILKWSLDDSWHDGQGQCPNNIPVIRYAEVLLNYAEAKAELGEFGSTEWNETIKLLRDRAGVVSTEPVAADSYIQSTFFPEISNKYLLEIRRERGIELCFEGLRYNDLMRWKKGELLASEEMMWKGIYIPAKDVSYDLNGDGKPDVCVVDEIPKPAESGVSYVVLGANIRLTEGDHGHLEWAYGIERKWEDKKYLRPIPKSAIDMNKNLLPQNEGWE